MITLECSSRNSFSAIFGIYEVLFKPKVKRFDYAESRNGVTFFLDLDWFLWKKSVKLGSGYSKKVPFFVFRSAEFSASLQWLILPWSTGTKSQLFWAEEESNCQGDFFLRERTKLPPGQETNWGRRTFSFFFLRSENNFSKKKGRNCEIKTNFFRSLCNAKFGRHVVVW